MDAATTSDISVLAGKAITLTIGLNTYIAAVTATSTTTLFVSSKGRRANRMACARRKARKTRYRRCCCQRVENPRARVIENVSYTSGTRRFCLRFPGADTSVVTTQRSVGATSA
jgi:hypothetical protein